MIPEESSRLLTAPSNPFSAKDVLGILQERGWLASRLAEVPDRGAAVSVDDWCARAAGLLGAHAADGAALAELLGLIFSYDAHEVLERVSSHVALSRYGAREVIRHLALQLIDGSPVTSDRLKEIITVLKEELHVTGPELFHPIRLVLAGRAGEGKLDRVILLLDEAAGLPFATAVKSARARVLEFCAALD